MIGLVDATSFYASCEKAFRPWLRNKSVVVLSNNDHWLIAVSPEAQALGLKRGQRFHEVKDVLEKNQVSFFSSNYTLYNDMSLRILATLKQFSTMVEPYSIDESFFQVGFNRDYLNQAKSIQEAIEKQCFIHTTIGIGRTKALAKVAQRIAKKQSGIVCLLNRDAEINALRQTPIDDVWGIGQAYRTYLTDLGFKTAWDFTQAQEYWIKDKMTIVGWRLYKELIGWPQNELKIEGDPRKQIISAKQFGHQLRDLKLIKEAAGHYLGIALEKLREQNSSARIINVSLEGKTKLYASGSRILPNYSDYLPTFLKHVHSILDSIYEPDKWYWRTTVMLFDLLDNSLVPRDMFTPEKKPHGGIMDRIDAVNHHYGRGTIRLAGSMQTEDWTMRREFLGGEFTTNLKDSPEAHTL